MAVRKTTTRRTAKKPPLKSASKGARKRMPVSVAFRIFLLIVIIIAFFMILPIIKNLRLNATATETEEGTGNKEQVTEGKKPQTDKPAEQTTVKPQTQPENKPQTEKPTTPAQPSTTPTQPSTPPVSTPPVNPVETRDRSIYLIQEGNMAQVKINRSLKVSDTPLKDSVNALLAGPTADEKKRGIISLVPEGSRLLSARVDGTTAYLDFNQEFRYNTRGSEGCAAQIKQIVWTATEFPNVRDVQFLIEGNIVNFLSEGVVIKSPISR